MKEPNLNHDENGCSRSVERLVGLDELERRANEMCDQILRNMLALLEGNRS